MLHVFSSNDRFLIEIKIIAKCFMSLNWYCSVDFFDMWTSSKRMTITVDKWFWEEHDLKSKRVSNDIIFLFNWLTYYRHTGIWIHTREATINVTEYCLTSTVLIHQREKTILSPCRQDDLCKNNFFFPTLYSNIPWGLSNSNPITFQINEIFYN